MPLPRAIPPQLRNVLLGLLAAVAALALQWAIRPVVEHRVPFLFVLPALLFCAVALGPVAAAIVLLFGAANAVIWLTPTPQWSLPGPDDRLTILCYLLVGTFLIVYGRRVRLRSARAVRAEERLKLAQDETGMGLFELDFQAGSAYVSPSLCQLLGQPVAHDPIPLARWFAALNAGHVEDTLRVLQQKVAAGELRYEREQRVELVDGRVRWLLTRVRLELDARGRLALARGAAVDITERKELVAQLESTQAELRRQLDDLNRLHAQHRAQQHALQEADRRKDEFLATLAHELRNPLAPVRQAVAVARNSATDEQRNWSLGVIERQVERMALLLDDLLDVARITRGTLQLRLVRTELGPIVDAALETARPLLDARRHRFELEIGHEPLSLDADPLRMAQLFGNLLTNAAKYTAPGGRIVLSARRIGDELQVAVSDNGIGLRPEDLERVFDMFAQVSSDCSQGGLGIGLALSRRLAALHGGRIEVRSDGPGCGSTFTVCLPAAEAAPSASQVRPAVEHASLVPRRILVVDDNQDAADSLAMLLELQGHEVQVAYDGEEALERYAVFRPEIALLDMGMPGRNGCEVARYIRRERGDTRTTLVAVTGWGQPNDRQRAADAGFDDHLTKPVDLERLNELLAALEAASQES